MNSTPNFENLMLNINSLITWFLPKENLHFSSGYYTSFHKVCFSFRLLFVFFFVFSFNKGRDISFHLSLSFSFCIYYLFWLVGKSIKSFSLSLSLLPLLSSLMTYLISLHIIRNSGQPSVNSQFHLFHHH